MDTKTTKAKRSNGPRRRDVLASMGATAGLFAFGPALAQQAPGIRRGGTLSVMREVDTSSLDPMFGNATTLQRKIYHLFAEALLRQDQKSNLQPLLAESWTVSEDGKTIVFKLRQGVVFHDGTPFNAEAAKFNLDRLIDPELHTYPLQYVTELQSIDMVDDYTIQLNLSSPSVLVLPMMAAEAGMMMSPTAVKEKGEDFGRSPVGTGPFKVTGRTTGEVQTVRNENYWRDGEDGRKLPYLDGVHLTVQPNTAVRLMQLESGAVQLADAVSTKDFAKVEENPDLQLLESGIGLAFILNYNVTRAPLDNIDLRKAISHCIDRKVLVQVMSQGYGVPLTGVEPPSSWLFDPSLKGQDIDLDLAKASLAKSGFTGTLTITIQPRDDDQQVAVILQQMMAQIGLNVKIEAIERSAFNANTIDKHDYDMAISRSPLQRPDVHVQYAFSYARDASTNYTGFVNDEIFDLVDKARVELDRDKRKAIYVQIQQLVLDNYYQSYLYWHPRREVASAKLHNIVYDGSAIWIYDDMWLEA